MPRAVDVVTASEALHARVRALIDATTRGALAEPFDELALAIARFQAEHVAPVGRLVRARGVDLGAAATADAIPAVPCDVFRLARVAAHPPALDVRVFRTSGTTQGREARGEHALRTTATYEAAALAFGAAMLWPDGPRLRAIVLAPAPDEAPDSSLGFMIDRFASRLERPSSVHLRGGVLDVDGLERACAAAREAGEPALVMGTSFAFVHLLDASEGRELALPAGSRAMQTGGFKGRSREVAPGELRAAIARLFAIEDAAVVGEYGMTELSSQLYEATLVAPGTARHGVYVAPPWVRVSAVDPASLRPLPEGELGIGRIVDLANVDSAVAIQTSDRVRVTGEGVELLGRAPGATPRGCSIAIDDMLGGAAGEAGAERG
jgi:hypothetical protein